MSEVASGGADPSLLLGAILLAALLGAYALLGWWLFLSPLGEPVPRRAVDAGTERLALVAILLYFAAGTAGIWDTSWHMELGLLGAVEDFWWPPHLVIYAGFGLTSLAAFLALARVLASPGGGVRSRFRAQPLLAVFGFTALFQMLSGPSDELWHRIYGVDLTGWSLPHLMLVGMSAVALSSVAAFYAAATRRRSRAHLLVATLPFVVLLWSWTAVAVGDWEFATEPGVLPSGSPVFARAGWQYVVAGVCAAAPILGLAVALLERRWTATAVAGLTVVWSAAAFLFFALLGGPLPLWTTPLAVCAGAFAVDALRGRGGAPLPAGALYGVVHGAVVLLATVLWTRVVPISPADAAVAAGLGLLVGALGYAAGHAVGGRLRRLPASPVGAPADGETHDAPRRGGTTRRGSAAAVRP